MVDSSWSKARAIVEEKKGKKKEKKGQVWSTITGITP